MCDYVTSRKSGVVLRQYANDIVKEVFRKVIHLCAAFIPILLKYFYQPILILLSSVLILYVVVYPLFCVFNDLVVSAAKLEDRR